jgi:hypothetical protein
MRIPINCVLHDAVREHVEAPRYLLQAFREEMGSVDDLNFYTKKPERWWEVGTPAENPGVTTWRLTTTYNGDEYAIDHRISDLDRTYSNIDVDAEARERLLSVMNTHFAQRGFPALTERANDDCV